jgi:hypothetical protein
MVPSVIVSPNLGMTINCAIITSVFF